MSSQEAFLARVRRALHTEAAGHTLGQQPGYDRDETVVTLQPQLAQRPSLIARLQQELQAVSGIVTLVPSAAAATQYITQLVQSKQASFVVRWQSALLERLEIDTALQQHGVTMHTTTVPPQDTSTTGQHDTVLATRRRQLRELLARADLGVSGVDYVIAETGTLVLRALPGHMRGVSLLPPVHVAVATTAQVVATLADALALIQATGEDSQQALSSCLSFVTGPSRTADIELQLVVGVHGPKELYLVLVDEPLG